MAFRLNFSCVQLGMAPLPSGQTVEPNAGMCQAKFLTPPASRGICVCVCVSVSFFICISICIFLNMTILDRQSSRTLSLAARFQRRRADFNTTRSPVARHHLIRTQLRAAVIGPESKRVAMS